MASEQFNGMILTARFKPSIKAKILRANLTTLTDIKVSALKTKTLEGEKKTKPNGSSFLINPLNAGEDIYELIFGNIRGGYNTGGFRGGPSQQRGGGRCS
jgi:hypothetical protein